MNAARRKEIERALGWLEEAKDILAQCQQEEMDYYDNMPDSIQSSERGEKADEAATALQEALDAFDEVVEAAERARDGS